MIKSCLFYKHKQQNWEGVMRPRHSPLDRARPSTGCVCVCVCVCVYVCVIQADPAALSSLMARVGVNWLWVPLKQMVAHSTLGQKHPKLAGCPWANPSSGGKTMVLSGHQEGPRCSRTVLWPRSTYFPQPPSSPQSLQGGGIPGRHTPWGPSVG